jgi:hypothetical protein
MLLKQKTGTCYRLRFFLSENGRHLPAKSQKRPKTKSQNFSRYGFLLSLVAIKLSSKGFYGQKGKKVAGNFNSGEIIL